MPNIIENNMDKKNENIAFEKSLSDNNNNAIPANNKKLIIL